MKDLLVWSCTAAALLCLACADQEHTGVSGVGTLEAREVLISSKSAGTVLRLPVREGDVVTVGQLVAVIDSEKVFLQKQQLLAGLEELRYTTVNAQRGVQLAEDQLDHIGKKFERIRSLWQDSSATLQQYEDIETAHKAAVTQHANARTTLDALRAKKAQLDAQLLLVNSQLADLQHMWIKIYLNEGDLGRIRIGQAADLQIASRPDQRFPGRVTWISPKAEFTPKNVQTREARSDLVYAVKIAVENPDGVLKIGMPADVYLR